MARPVFQPLVLGAILSVSVIVFSPASGQTTDRSYSGSIMRSSEKDVKSSDPDSIPPGHDFSLRMLWSAGKAHVIMCANAAELGLNGLARGSLDNSAEGILTGSLTQSNGQALGSLTLRKRKDGNSIVWEGTLGPDHGYHVSVTRDESAGQIDKNYPLIVTKKFMSKPPYIPLELFVYAYPHFEKFDEALQRLDSVFPNWRGDKLSCDEQLSGSVTMNYRETNIMQIGSIVDDLRKSGYFRYVELGVAEYGGLPEQVIFSAKKYPHNTLSTMLAHFNRIAAAIARVVFCAEKCTPTPMSAKGENVRVYEIVGRSEDLHFKKKDHWEKYVVAMTAYSEYSDDKKNLAVQFSITSGFNAPSGNGERPPDARFKENPIDDAELSTLSSKLQRVIAEKLGGEYQEEE